MTTPEGKVKAHLVQRIQALGGDVRFAKWIERHSCPDCRVMLHGRCCWVETKAKDGVLSGGQVREFARMRDYGETVLVLHTKELIDKEFPAP